MPVVQAINSEPFVFPVTSAVTSSALKVPKASVELETEQALVSVAVTVMLPDAVVKAETLALPNTIPVASSAPNSAFCNYSDPSAKNPESWLKKLYINPNEIK